MSTGRIKTNIGSLLIRACTALFAILFIMPFYVCIVTALKTPEQSALSTLSLPASFMLDNFKKAIEVSKFGRSFINSMITTVCSVLLIVLCSAMCGYVISRNMRKKFYKVMDTVMLAGIMIPFQVIMIPVYRMYKGFDLLNSLIGVIILMAGTSIPYAAFLMTGFIKTVPVQLEESAKIDGCGVIHTFWRIVFPLLKPISFTVGILHALWMWNEFNMSIILLQKDEVRTIPIQQFYFFGQYTVNLNLGFASACLSMIPIIAYFLFAQKSIISGITLGAVKG